MKNTLVNNIKTVVIGSGPVGLTTAKILQQSGADVTVYERDNNPQARIRGGTLDIHKGSGQNALEMAGVLEAYYQNARPTRERTADMKGNILKDNLPTEQDKYLQPEIDRADLRNILLAGLHKDTVIWDSQVVKINEEGNRYQIQLKNGTTAFADLVIVANGGMSAVRSEVTDAVPEYTGSFVIQGEVTDPDVACPDFKELSGGGNFVVFGEQKVLACQTKRNGAIVFYVSFRPAENRVKENIDFNNRNAVMNLLLNLFKNWDIRYKELLQASEEFTPLSMKRMPVEKQWHAHRNITLVGDAAHLMPPFAGQGVNIGLLDAFHLTENLTSGNFSDLHSAIMDYEQKMFDYASTAQRITSLLEIKCHSENALQEIEELMKNLFK